MATCPACKEEFKTRKEGACPKCGEYITKYGNHYYKDADGNPANVLLEHFERLVSERTSKIQGKRVVYRTPKRSPLFKAEIAAAKRLLNQCDGDLQLTVSVVDTLFVNPQFARRNYTALRYLSSDFALAKTVTETHLADLARKDNKEADTFVNTMGSERLFDY